MVEKREGGKHCLHRCIDTVIRVHQEAIPMMGRPLISKTIAALVVVATCLVQQCRCSRMLSFYNQYRAGLQGISQECAPRRKRKQNVVVNTVELVCDSDENNDYYSYTNSLTCRTGDIAKVAVGCKCGSTPFLYTWNSMLPRPLFTKIYLSSHSILLSLLVVSSYCSSTS